MEDVAAYYDLSVAVDREALTYLVPIWLMTGLWMAVSVRAVRKAPRPRALSAERGYFENRDFLSLPTLVVLLAALSMLQNLFDSDVQTSADVVYGVWQVAFTALVAFLVVLGMASIAAVAVRRWRVGRRHWLPRLSFGAAVAAVDVCAIWLFVLAICHVFYEAG